jgi:hypothetical protein
MAKMAESLGALLRDLADSMKALDDRKSWFPPREDFSSAADDFEEKLVAKYRNLPPPKLSEKLKEKLGARYRSR